MLFSTRLTWQIWEPYTSQIIRLRLSTEHNPLLSDCPLLLHLAIYYNSLIIFTMTCDRSIAAHLFVLGLWNLRSDATNYFFSMIMAWPLLLPHQSVKDLPLEPYICSSTSFILSCENTWYIKVVDERTILNCVQYLSSLLLLPIFTMTLVCNVHV